MTPTSHQAALPFVQHSDRCQRSGMGACLCGYDARLAALAEAMENYCTIKALAAATNEIVWDPPPPGVDAPVMLRHYQEDGSDG